MSTVLKPTPADKREQNLNPKIKLPRERYTVRVIKEEFAISRSSNNPMIVLTTEFVNPESFTNPADGSTVNIAGVELKKYYIPLCNKDDARKSQDAFNRYCDLRALVGDPVGDDGVDVENPPKSFDKKLLSVIADGEEYSMRKDPTPEQRARKEQGDVIKDENGNELKGYSPYIVNILGLSNFDTQGRHF